MATPAMQARPPQTARSAAPPLDVLEVPPDSNFIASLTRGEVLSQVEVARRWPRVISTFLNQTRAMALLDEDTSASCFYALPRKDKGKDRTIEGPSIRFAEILNSAWGHMRVEGRVVDELDRFVVSRGTAWDVQQNIIVAYEVRRNIMGHYGRYNDDMIAVTANAAASIAMRDAILRVIPQPLWRSIWLEAKKVAVGDGTTLAKRRKEMLDYFQKLGVRPERTLAVVDAQSEADITLEKLAELRGLATAIRDGQTTVDEAFPEIRPGQGPVQMPQRQESTSPPSSPGAPASTTPGTATTLAGLTPAAPPAPASDPEPLEPAITLTALKVVERPGKTPYWLAEFSHGLQACTFIRSMGEALERAKVAGVVYADIVTHKANGFVYIDELLPRDGPGV